MLIIILAILIIPIIAFLILFITHLADVSVLHLLMLASRPVEIVGALLLGNAIKDEVV